MIIKNSQACFASVLAASALLFTACASAPATVPSSPIVEPTHLPITTQHPLLDVFPLGVGTTRVYQVGRSDECIGKSTTKSVGGRITETVTSAWQLDGALVFKLALDTSMYGVQQQLTHYYVLMDNKLYRTTAAPEQIVSTRGAGCEDRQVLAWPLEVDGTFGDQTDSAKVWRVAGQESLGLDVGLANGCFRMEQRGFNTTHDVWFCPQLGFAQYRDQAFVAPISDEMRQLISIQTP